MCRSFHFILYFSNVQLVRIFTVASLLRLNEDELGPATRQCRISHSESHRITAVKLRVVHGDTTQPDPPVDPTRQQLWRNSTNSLKPKFHYADFPVTPASPRQTRNIPVDLSATSPTFPCLVADVAAFPVSSTQTGFVADLSRENCSNRLDMSRWYETPRLPRADMIHVGDFPVTNRRLSRNILVTCVMGKFRGSRRNGIWA